MTNISQKQKSIHFIKENVEFTEYAIHQIVYNLEIVNVPKIVNYDKDTKQLTLKNISNDCLSNIYGEEGGGEGGG